VLEQPLSTAVPAMTSAAMVCVDFMLFSLAS
jgi:hypothetical protein